jgi:hypothetical protein
MQEKIPLSSKVVRAAVVSKKGDRIGNAALIQKPPNDRARRAASCAGLLCEAFGEKNAAQLEGTVAEKMPKSVHREAKRPSESVRSKRLVEPIKGADERLRKHEAGTHGSFLLAS